MLGVAESRVVVESDFPVDGPDAPVSRQDEGVYFDEGRVLLCEDLPEFHEDGGDPVCTFGGETGLVEDFEGDRVVNALERVEGDFRERFGAFLREGFNVHPSFFGAQREMAALRTVEED